jgi:hypothetical protein
MASVQVEIIHGIVLDPFFTDVLVLFCTLPARLFYSLTGAILITQKHISRLTKHIKYMCERQKCATHC